MQEENSVWLAVCSSDELIPNIGVRALVNGKQIALFKVKDSVYAIDAVDPFSKTAVLSRGIVGDIKGKIVVASPLYKQHFDLATGHCLEDEGVSVNTYPVRQHEGRLELSMV